MDEQTNVTVNGEALCPHCGKKANVIIGCIISGPSVVETFTDEQSDKAMQDVIAALDESKAPQQIKDLYVSEIGRRKISPSMAEVVVNGIRSQTEDAKVIMQENAAEETKAE
ncbi:MAG: hypothetical protein WC455_10190 [Dehalococcoidia bacterium]|jgi:hypothetical protein